MSKRYAIISDIHANIEALEAVIRDAEAMHVDTFVCLGDVVGYNASPSECIRRIRKLGCKVVKGNHDHYCSHPDVDLDDFQPNAASVIEWTRRNISDDDTEWLHNLPLSLKFMGFTLVHSTLDSPGHFRYAFSKEDALDSFLSQGTRVCFHGHTHVPCIFRRRPGGETCHDIDKLIAADGRLDPGNYFINVGSVGQPRDGDPRACYVIFDVHSLNDLEIQFRRVDYDVEAAISHIQEAGLPDRLVQRLYTGL
ncbi:MAG: metallophosphoesterase family protein [bacterium]|nr:metallophosphoesterase family protein [bacterium]MDO5462651.1 metallophosphoesterase family protein [bacterium]